MTFRLVYLSFVLTKGWNNKNLNKIFYFVNLSATHAAFKSSVNLFLLSDLIKFKVENSCSQEYDDLNKVRRAIPSDFIDLKLIGRDFHTLRTSFSELFVAFSVTLPSQSIFSSHRIYYFRNNFL